MFLNPRADLFNFMFTKDFIPTTIASKYENYLNSVVGSPITKAIDYVNYSIQGINLPGLSYDIVEQMSPYGWTRKHRSSTHPQELMSKELTVTMKMLDGFVNYWLMFDVLSYYYEVSKPSEGYIPDQRIEILDSCGNVVRTILLKRMLYNNISELNLNFSSNNPEFLTFDLSFVYNQLDFGNSFDSSH